MNTVYETLVADATAFLLEHPGNHVQADDAIREDLIGMQMFDAPLFAVGDADDPWFERLCRPDVVHPEYRLPKEWVPGAKSVISFFAPFTERIRVANAENMRFPADEWLHGRFEGELMLKTLRLYLRDKLRVMGYEAVVPMHDERFQMLAQYASNWSERHTGFICGLGTFGMSKGLITEKGIAGRMGSVITDCVLPVTERIYREVYGNCIQCGACVTHCPVKCIDPTRGMDHAKNHPPCDAFLNYTEKQPPRGKSGRQRYGCGKCQVGVPCEHQIPKKNC